MDINKEALALHAKLVGKIEIKSKVKATKDNLPLLYTPGVAAVSSAIFANKKRVYDYTSKANTIAIVSNGSRLLSLGNVGPEAAIPVMEGKSLIYKEYADVNAIPLCINSSTLQEIVSIIKAISPSYGAINLEDIQSPLCLEINDVLSSELDIPIFHDDQQGTAVAVLAALINSLKLVKKNLQTAKIVVLGAGTAGYGIVNLLVYAGCKNILALDGQGTLYAGRQNMNKYKEHLASITNLSKMKGNLADALYGADVCIAVCAQKDIIKSEHVQSMNSQSIVFALSNPDPEILPSLALEAGAAIAATGRSDFENQVNNSIVFPFLMKKILTQRINKVDTKLLYHAAIKIAKAIKPSLHHIVPTMQEMKEVKL